jgi:hypothetical protein
MDMMEPKTEKAVLREMTETRPGRTNFANLKEQIAYGKLLPTTSCDYKSRGPNSKQGGIDQTIKMLPTPAVRDVKGMNSPEHLARERGHHDQLPNALGMKTGLKLQPAFVEWMMGYPQGWTDLNSPSPLTELNA